MKKTLNKIDFVIEILSKMGEKEQCHFCKYNMKNYTEYDGEASKFFTEKCIHCIYHYKTSKILESTQKKIYVVNNYKSLYEWEEEEKT